MNIVKTKLLLLVLLLSVTGFSQVTLNQYQVGVGNSSNQLSGSSALTYNNGLLTMGSTTDNYLAFSNQAGTSYLQNDANGHFIWYTPSSSGSAKMKLTNGGNLLIGTSTDAGYMLAVNGSANALSYSLNTQGMTNKIVFNADQSKVYISKTAYASLGHLHVKDMDDYSNVIDPSLALATFDVNGENIPEGGSNQVYNATSVNVNASSMPLTGASVLGQFVMKGIEVRAKQQVNTTFQNPYSANSQAFGIKINAINGDTGYWAHGAYGIYVDASAARSNTAYGIYSNSGMNYFAEKVTIGTTGLTDTSKLLVNGTVKARKLRVDQSTWADFVFHPNYKLPSLKEVEQYIQRNQHLPGIASAQDVQEKGIDIGDNQAKLLQKIEELTLYVIDLNKKVDRLSKENSTLKKKVASIKK